MSIWTVQGPIEAADLGPTSMHEHVLCDGRVYLEPGAHALGDEPLSLRNRGPLSRHYLGSSDNLVLDEPELAVEELGLAAAAGLSGVVELTTVGLHRRVRELVDIARRSGVHLMVGCGVYVQRSHPAWVAEQSEEQLAERLISELDHGIDGTDVRAALVGEIGTSDPITGDELKVLHAAAHAASATGAAVNVHQTTGQHGLVILEHLCDRGVEPSRAIFSHLDDDLDPSYHLALGDAGAVVELDTFGHEAYLRPGHRWPTDHERADAVGVLLSHGFVDQVVLGCDIWTKGALRAYGGMGYEHLMLRVRELLAHRAGASEADLAAMLVHTPRRLLDRPDMTTEGRGR